MNDLLGNFSVLGMRPTSLLSRQQLDDYGNEEVAALRDLYGKKQSVQRKEDGEIKTATSDPVIDPKKTKAEWTFLKKAFLAEQYPRDSMKDL